MPDLPEIPEMSADRLTSQLYHLPAIIGRLGLSVANAQKALNADYTANVKELMHIAMKILPGLAREKRTALESLIKQLAPSRYQFTETTLDFSADLSESLDVAGSAGLGAGFGAVVINAGVSVGYGRDYRAAARVKTVLSAIPAHDVMLQKLIEQADDLTDKGVTLPPRTDVDAAVYNGLGDVQKMLGGEGATTVAAELPLTPLQQVERAADEAEKYQASAEEHLEKATAANTAAEADTKKKMVAEAANSAKAALQAHEGAQLAAGKVKDPDEKTKAGEVVTRALTAANAAQAAADAAADL